MQFVKRSVGAKKNLMLAEACAHYGLDGGNHRAARDVLATHRLLEGIIAGR
jgi:DNA polymerase III epsilon subunit-like protein